MASTRYLILDTRFSMLDAWMCKWVDAAGGLFITMARSLHYAPVLSLESTEAPVGMTRGCVRALSLDARFLMLDT